MAGSYLCDKIYQIESSGCCQCWCDSSERRPQHHLAANWGKWAPQRKRVRKEIGEACRWKHPRTPLIRAMFEDEGEWEQSNSFCGPGVW